MKSIIQKVIIPARTQSQDKKFQTSRRCEVRRSGQVTTFVVCAVFSLSFQAVVLLTKTVINHRFFQSSLRWVDGFKKFQRLWVKELLLYNRIEFLFRKFSSEVEKCIMCSSIQVLPNQVSKKSFYTFEDIELWESHAKVHNKPSETLGADSILRLEISIYCLLGTLSDFCCIQCSFTEMKSPFINLQNESLRKILAKNYL